MFSRRVHAGDEEVVMGLLALVLMTAFLVVGLGVRGWQHRRRYRHNVLGGLKRKPGTKEWYIGKCMGTGAFAIAVAAVLDATGVLAPLPTLHFAAVEVAGVVMALVGFAAAEWAVTAMAETWRVSVDTSEQVRLVTTGPFSLVRNPVYTGLAVTMLGITLMVANLVSIPGWITLAAGLELQVRLLEEPYLRGLHGKDFDDYSARVGRFVPGLGRRVHTV
jgi:protein-S-isoprenylcysteine O-methyltransferase Ste14